MAKNNPVTEITSMFNVFSISGLPDGVTWKQEGNKVTFSQPVFIDDETGEISLTNKNKIKMKEILEHIYNLGHISLNESGREELKRLINEVKYRHKKLRKEDKKLKKVLEATEFAINMLKVTSIPMSEMYKKQRDLLIDEFDKSQPAAIFMCAKTHNPSKDGVYIVIVSMDSGKPFFTNVKRRHGEWLTTWEVLAFTETDPQEIINYLNK